MLYLHLVALVGVDDGGAANGGSTLNLPSVIHVDVTVDEIYLHNISLYVEKSNDIV